jgi:hypothetical protein
MNKGLPSWRKGQAYGPVKPLTPQSNPLIYLKSKWSPLNEAFSNLNIHLENFQNDKLGEGKKV